jgi:hypothetical protein
MRPVLLTLRACLLFAALAVTALGLMPSKAHALKSCEYYCGPAGPYTCNYAPPVLHCTWQAF